MNPVQQHFPSSMGLCLVAVEQALTDSQAREIDMQDKLEMLLDGYKHLERLMLELQTPTLPKFPADIIPVQTSPTG